MAAYAIPLNPKQSLCEFLSGAIQQILYFAKVYHKSVFEERSLFNTAVHISRSPDLLEYVENVCIYTYN